MKKKVIKVCLFLLLIFLFFFFSIKNNNDKLNRLREKGMYVTAKIVDFDNFKADVNLDYTFTSISNVEVFRGSVRSNFATNKIFIGKFFPLIYNRENPNENKILMTRKDFEIFNIPYPDSLSWVDKCYYYF